MCRHQTKSPSKTLLGSLIVSTAAAIPNLTRAGLTRYNPFQGAYLSDKPAIDRRLAKRIHILLSVVSGKNRYTVGVAKPLPGQRASRRDKILLGHCICRSFNHFHRQNWLAEYGPLVFRNVLCRMGSTVTACDCSANRTKNFG